MLCRQLRTLLAEPGKLVRLAGAHNALGARLAEKAGFDGVWASSLEISASWGQEDTDACTMTHVLPAAAAIAHTVDFPVVADCGAGGCGPAEAAQMARAFEAAGIAGICIEDAQYPMQNSLRPGRHALATIREFSGKIRAAKRAQQHDLVVIARVEALIARAPLTEALQRAHAYAEAGADAVLIHSKSATPDEVLAFIHAWDRDVSLVLVPTTYHSLSEWQLLEPNKVKMVIYANQCIRAAIAAMDKVLRQILMEGTAHGVESWIAPLPRLFELQDSFDPADSHEDDPSTDANLTTVGAGMSP